MADRRVVKTYVSPEQKETWKAAADDRDMSLSEFVATMTQAGRRGFEGVEEQGSTGSNPGGDGLESVVLDALAEEGALAFDELVAAITEDIEARLDETLQELQDTGAVRYSGRKGGFVRTDE